MEKENEHVQEKEGKEECMYQRERRTANMTMETGARSRTNNKRTTKKSVDRKIMNTKTATIGAL